MPKMYSILYGCLLVMLSIAPAHAEAIQMLPPVQSDDMIQACKDAEGNKILSWDGKTAIKCNRHVVVDDNGNLGVGNDAPKSKLDVTGGVKVGNDAASCTAAKAGTVRWNGSELAYCNGSVWKSVSPAPYLLAGGVDVLAEDNTGRYGYCRLAWGAVTACGPTGVTCSVGTPQVTTMSHDNIGRDEDQSAGKFISSHSNGAHVSHVDCVLTVQ